MNNCIKSRPKIAFNDNDQEWVCSTLASLIEVHSGQDYKHLNEGDVPVYGTGGWMLNVDGVLSNENAVGIGRKGTIDKPFLLNAPFWTVDTLYYCTVKNNSNLDFIYALFQSIDWKTKDESTGVPSLSKKAILDTTVSYPVHKEDQMKIGKILNILDKLIAFEKEKYESLICAYQCVILRISGLE